MLLAETDMSIPKHILALDGGDFRGLSSLILLRGLMERVRSKGNASASMRPCDYFDLIVGAGTGGLSALFVGRMGMTVDEAIDAYLLVGDQCFKRSTVPLLQRLQGKEPLFDGESVTRVIGDIAQKFVSDRDAQLQDPPGVMGAGRGFCRTAVLTAYSANASAPPFVFRSYHTHEGIASTHTIHQAARATIATAGAFPPISIGSPPIEFIDASVAGYNNPSEVALDEMTRIWPGAKVTCLVSLGTGLQNIVRVGETSEDVMRVARRLMEDCEKVHNRLLQKKHHDGLPYYRFNVTTGLDGPDIKGWDTKTSGVIAGITEGHTRKPDVDVSLDSCACILTANVTGNFIVRDSDAKSSLLLPQGISYKVLSNYVSVWLNAPEISPYYHDACKKHQDGTGTWFTDGEIFSGWMKDRDSFLCMYGNPGSGKTILCSSIITHVSSVCRGDESSAYAYFFFDGRNAQKNFQLLDSLIRSLIRQFTDQCDEIPSTLVQLYGKGHEQPSTDALEDVLRDIISGFKDAYVIIDSLDECTERKELVAWITQMTSATQGQLHFLSTSRPEMDILDNLKSVTPIYMDDEFVKGDIKAYIDRKIQTEFKTWDGHNQSKIKEALVKGAHGMFRWVALQIDELRGCSSAYTLEKQLKSLSEGLDETYERILLRINKQYRDDARRFLSWIAFSTRTLTLEELAEVVVVDFDTPNGPTYAPNRKYWNQEDVLKACSSLITISRGSVKLAHFSVKEYLLSDRIANGPAKYFSINENTSHLFIAKTSIAYLMQFDSPGPLNDETLAAAPLAEYAACNWVFHVRSGGGDGVRDIHKNILTLLESGNPFANWIRLWDLERSRIRTPTERWATDAAEPLYVASLLGFTRVARQLLQKGANVNGPRHASHGALKENSYMRYGNALQAACHEDHEEMVDLLMISGADVNVRGGKYGCALQAAALNSSKPTVQFLLDWGADVNIQGGKYGCALQAAAWGGNQATVELLLDRGADIHARGGKYGCALQAAVSRGNLAIAQSLLDLGGAVNMRGGLCGSPLQAACIDGNMEIVKLLLDRNADVNMKEGPLGSPLQAACIDGNVEIVKLLLDNHAEVNSRGGLFGNPLQAAAGRDHVEVIKILLENNVDVNAQGGAGGNALMMATVEGNDDVVKLLLQNGADVNAPAKDYIGTFEDALGEHTIMQVFQEKKVSAEGEYVYVLQAASYHGHKKIVDMLLDYRADVNAQGGTHGNAVQAALDGEEYEIARLLLDYGELLT